MSRKKEINTQTHAIRHTEGQKSSSETEDGAVGFHAEVFRQGSKRSNAISKSVFKGFSFLLFHATQVQRGQNPQNNMCTQGIYSIADLEL